MIVEDEQHTTRLLKSYISQIDKLELLSSFTSPVDLLNSGLLDQVQIIYLDIQMPGMTGIDFLKLKPLDCEVIMITAYHDFAIEGFELNVTDYLLKPVELPRFVKATQKAIQQIQLKSSNTQPDTFSEYITLKVDKKLIRVTVEDILYVQSDWNYLLVHTNNDKYMILSTMKSIEAELDSHDFFRIHKSFLVNMKKAKSIEGNMLEVMNGTKLPISRNFRQEVLKRFS